MKRVRNPFSLLTIVLSLPVHYPTCRSLTFPSRSRRLFSTDHVLPSRNNRLITSTALFSSNKTETEDDAFIIHDQSLLMADIVATVVACQLLGLQDAIDNPAFWQNGGWFQSPTFPSSLPTLCTRISENSISWVAASLAFGGYDKVTTSTSSSEVIATAGKGAAGFVVVRLLVAIIASAALSDDWNGVEVLRECYFVSLAAIGARYSVHRLFYG